VNDPCEPVYHDKVVADVYYVCPKCIHRLSEFFDQWGNLTRGGEDYNAPSSESVHGAYPLPRRVTLGRQMLDEWSADRVWCGALQWPRVGCGVLG